MPEVYTIPLSKIIHELQLETAFLPKSADDILIQSRDVVRPGMELNGYHEYFDPNRIAVLGRAEMYMLESLRNDCDSGVFCAADFNFSKQRMAAVNNILLQDCTFFGKE